MNSLSENQRITVKKELAAEIAVGMMQFKDVKKDHRAGCGWRVMKAAKAVYSHLGLAEGMHIEPNYHICSDFFLKERRKLIVCSGLSSSFVRGHPESHTVEPECGAGTDQSKLVSHN